jgi:hypothetical protein
MMPDDQFAGLLGLAPSMPDLPGTPYHEMLARLHAVLCPRRYLEIGVETGATLALARCAAIGIDPVFHFGDIELVRQITAKPRLMLFQMTSDAFFADHDPAALLGGPIEMAFLDGMHRCEFLLRDFINTERHCRPNAVVALHDCVPLELPMAGRIRGADPVDPRRRFMWTGDVWRTVLLLRRVRPDLEITVLDAAPTGLVLITNLNPASTLLRESYARFVQQMMGWSLESLTLPAFYQEIGLEPAQNLQHEADITARFWL